MNPPPPPPHGEAPKSSGLPPGRNFDIFIIPPHSAGSGFIYLPSLKPNINSFIAGFATALVLVALLSMLAPAFHIWWHNVKGLGGMGTILLMMAIGLGAWSLGRVQVDGGPGPGGGDGTAGGGAGSGAGGQWSQSNGYAGGGQTPGAGTGGPRPGWQQTNGSAGAAPNGAAGGPKQSWQNYSEGPQTADSQGSTRPTWETPKPETAQPPKADPAATGANPNTGAKSAWEKAREETKRREEERKAKEAEKKKKEELEQKLKEAREADRKRKEDLERRLKEAREKEAREREEREKRQKEEGDKPKGSTYAYSAVGEKTNPWPRGQPPAARSQPSSPTKRPPAPTAKTYLGTEDDAYSYRPYDKPKKPLHKKSLSSLYSESSYAASHSTSATSPPPSQRGPYSTKDPDKIVIKAVYSFKNGFLKTPTSQLVSGVGSVTDGLILRITTEGLFIDDDVRGVPQREWDVKAWTMKLVETGELKSAHLHVLRATIRDQEGRRYVFIITEEESWKVALGLQRLRKGSQVRALGVSGMSTGDARGVLEGLGWV